MKNIKESFKRLRIKYKLTQLQIAEILGLPRTAITNIENGKRELSFTEAYTFANFIFTLWDKEGPNDSQKTTTK